jgi:hypothetical protein
MRKRWLVRAALAGTLLSMLAVYFETKAAPFTQIAWQYDFTANAPCTATVTVNCVSGFELHHFSPTGADTLDTAIPVTGAPSGLTSLTTPLPAGYPSTGYGTVTAYMIAVGKDAGGASIKSAQSAFTVTRLPDAPMNPHAQ